MLIEKMALHTAIMLQDHFLIQKIEEECYYEPHSVSKIVMAVNQAFSEISLRFPIFIKKKLKPIGSVIPRCEMSGDGAFTVASVTLNGEPVPYTVDFAGIHIDNPSATYEVTFSPEIFDIQLYDDMDVPSDVGFVMILYLIARNYCTITGRMEEAAVYDGRYNDCAEHVRLKRRARIPARKFV